MTSAPRGNRNPTPAASAKKQDASSDEPAPGEGADGTAKRPPKRSPRQKTAAERVAQPAVAAASPRSADTADVPSESTATTRIPRGRTQTGGTAPGRSAASRAGATGRVAATRASVTGTAAAAANDAGQSVVTKRVVTVPAPKPKPAKKPRTKPVKPEAAAESVAAEDAAESVAAEDERPTAESVLFRGPEDAATATTIAAWDASDEASTEPESSEIDPSLEETRPRPVRRPEPAPTVQQTSEAPAAQHAALPETFVPPVAPDAETAPVVLSIRDLHKRFGSNVAVDGISLDVRQGSFYGIVGPNGAGKTTTLSIVTGLLRPDAGSVQVRGIDVWRHPVRAKRAMGVLPDHLRMFDRLTGAQLLFYSGTLRGLDPTTVRQRSADLASAFGLEDALGRLVADYSAGMTKKVALACAMIHSPRLLVLDEPFESVDPVSAANVIEILQRYVAGGGTVVLSSHGMDLIQRVCDSVAIIVGGLVLDAGTVDEVRGAKSLEERFVDLAGGRKAAEGMEWLHSFSD